MANDNSILIGHSPVWRGEYSKYTRYYKGNYVTMCSCVFMCNVSVLMTVPPLLVDNSVLGTYKMRDPLDKQWICVMDNLSVYNNERILIDAVKKNERVTEEARQAAAQATAAVADCYGASEAFREQSARANELMGECESIIHYARRVFSTTLIGEPTMLRLKYLPSISIKNKVKQRVGIRLTPFICSQSALFQTSGDCLDIDPSGYLTVKGLGTGEVTVIPTYNTSLWKKISITIRRPYIRMNGNRIRINSNNKIRIS